MPIPQFTQFSPILENYPLDIGRGWWQVLVPSQKTNLCLAPSFERGNSNSSDPFAGVWQIDPDITASVVATTQTQGARCLECFVDDPVPESGASTQVAVVAGTRYTFSLDFRSEMVGFEFELRIAPGISASPSIASSETWKKIEPFIVWKRPSISFVAKTTGTYSFAIVKTQNTGSALAAFYIDAVQIEVGDQTSYFDGDTKPLIVSRPEADLYQPQFYWTGEPHASPSVRTQYTRAGGEPVKLSDYGWLTKAIVGLGTPPFLPIGTPYAMTGGSEFNRVLPQERVFSLVGRICGDSFADLSRKRQDIQSLIAPVILAKSQPIILQYQPTDECDSPIGCAISIEAVYTDGFTGNTNNRFQEEVTMNFKSFNPFVQTETQQGAELARSRSFPFVATRFATGKWTDVVYDSGINANGIGDILWGLDGAIYMAQYTSTTNLALKRLRVGTTSWQTLQNITVSGVSIKNVRMTFSRDWKLWITGINFFPADATKRVGYYDVRGNSFTWDTPASIGGYGVDIQAGYKGEVYLVTQPTAGTVSSVFRYDNYSAPLGWKTYGTSDTLIYGVDVARSGRVYITGAFDEMVFNGTVSGMGAVATQSGELTDPYELMVEGIFGVGRVGYDIAVAPDGNVYVAGLFEGANTDPDTYSQNLVKWNGTSWEAVVSQDGMDGEIRRLYIALDNSIYIYGTFTEVEDIEVDWGAVYKRGRWQPVSIGGAYSGTVNGSPIMMAINPRSGDFVLARNITGSPVIPAYTNVYADMTAWSKPTIRLKGEGIIYSIVNHTSQSDVYFGSGFEILDQETVLIELSNLRPKVTSDVRGDISQFISPDSRLGSWRIMPGDNEIEVLYVNPTPASGWGGEVDIYWDVQHLTIDAAINCNFDTLPIPVGGKPDDGLVPEDAIDFEIVFDDPCFTLTWEPVEGAEYYEIEYSEDGEEWVFVGTAEDTEIEYCPDDESEEPFFRIRPVYPEGAGEWSEEQYEPAPPDERWDGDSLVYWTADEASGSRAALVGGLTLTDNNTVGSTAGIEGNAALFVAANSESLSHANDAMLSVGDGDFTLRVWANLAASQTNPDCGIMTMDNYPSSGREWHILYVPPDVRFNMQDSGGADIVSVSATMGASAWHHVVVTRLGADIKVYVDAGTPATGTIVGTPNTGAATFRLGSLGTGTSYYMDGAVDEIAVVKGIAWDAAQVTYDYFAGAGRRYPL